MSSIDQQFIEYIVKSLVSKPDEVKIERRIDEKGVLLELTVDAEDLGRVIGKRGATAQSLRTLLRALGTKNEARYNLKIIDTADGQPIGRPTRPMQDQNDDAQAPVQQNDVQDDSQDVVADEKSQEDSEAEEVAASTEEQADQTSDVISKARQELADLDDLDV